MVRSIGAFLVVGSFVGAFASCSPKSGDDPNQGGLAGTSGSAGFVNGGSGFGGVANAGGSVNPGAGGDTGGGPIFMLTGGNANGAGGKDAGCGGYTRTGELVPLDIYIMFDQSASMSCALAGGTRWDAVKAALTSFVQNAGAATINVGLGYFGTAASPPGSSCLPSDYKVDVEIGPLSSTAPLIVTSLNAHGPLTDTPTLPAIQSAVSHAISWKAQHPGHTVVVVLVTDGQPNACGANTVAQVVATTKMGFDDGGIPSYVIGIIGEVGADGKSTCNLDPNAPTVSDLDSVAAAGGTTKALIVDTGASQDPGAQFLATMNSIRQNAQIPCEYSIPPDKSTGEQPDAKFVNVDVQDPSKNVTNLFFVDTKAKCDATTGGWYFDTPQEITGVPEKPTKIILCPQTCTTVTGTFGYAVTIQLDCPRKGPPH